MENGYLRLVRNIRLRHKLAENKAALQKYDIYLAPRQHYTWILTPFSDAEINQFKWLKSIMVLSSVYISIEPVNQWVPRKAINGFATYNDGYISTNKNVFFSLPRLSVSIYARDGGDSIDIDGIDFETAKELANDFKNLVLVEESGRIPTKEWDPAKTRFENLEYLNKVKGLHRFTGFEPFVKK